MVITANDIKAAKETDIPQASMYDNLPNKFSFSDIIDAEAIDSAPRTWTPPGALPSSGIEPTYVSAFFAEKIRPKIRLGKIEAHPYGTIYAKVIGKNLTVKEATAYLWYFMGTISGQLDEDWGSYGIELGKKDDEVNAQVLLECETIDNENAILSSAEGGTDEKKFWLAMVCASRYRLHSSLRKDYKKELCTRITDYLAVIEKVDDFSLPEFVGTRGQWEQNKEYARVVVALDMFLIRFPEHEISRLRLCTIGARYKDCAALVGFEYLRSMLNVDYGELLMWVWTKGTADDIRRIFKGTEELDKLHSYLPYIASMKLALKSPYSASVNQSLHYFVHFCGGLMGHLRSLNARMVNEGSVIDSLFNAQVLAYAKGSRANWGQHFRLKGDVSNLKSVRQEGGVREGAGKVVLGQDNVPVEVPTDGNPIAWWYYVSAHGCQMPTIIENAIVSQALQIPGVRVQTVGAHLYNWAKGKAPTLR